MCAPGSTTVIVDDSLGLSDIPARPAHTLPAAKPAVCVVAPLGPSIRRKSGSNSSRCVAIRVLSRLGLVLSLLCMPQGEIVPAPGSIAAYISWRTYSGRVQGPIFYRDASGPGETQRRFSTSPPVTRREKASIRVGDGVNIAALHGNGVSWHEFHLTSHLEIGVAFLAAVVQALPDLHVSVIRILAIDHPAGP